MVHSYTVSGPGSGTVDTSVNDVSVIGQYDYPTLSQGDREVAVGGDVDPNMSRARKFEFAELPENTTADYVRLGFLLGFPTVMFLVACIVTGTAM